MYRNGGAEPSSDGSTGQEGQAMHPGHAAARGRLLTVEEVLTVSPAHLIVRAEAVAGILAMLPA